jgi:hypothetical protein
MTDGIPPNADMSCDPVTRSGVTMVGHGTEMQTDWSAQQPTIQSMYSAIGDDRLGYAFRVGYDNRSKSAQSVAAPLPGKFTDLGNVAKGSAIRYQIADQYSATCYPN